MSKLELALTDQIIRDLQPREKIYRKFDGKGLYIELVPHGGKWWRFKFHFKGKEKRISLGVYPEVSIELARLEATKYRLEYLYRGVDPVTRKTSRLGYGEAKNVTKDE